MSGLWYEQVPPPFDPRELNRDELLRLVYAEHNIRTTAEAERDSALAELARVREAVHAVERDLAWLPSRYTVADENALRVVGLLNTDAYKLAERLRSALSDAGQPQTGDSE